MNLDQLILVTEEKIGSLKELIQNFEAKYSEEFSRQEDIPFQILTETYTTILFSGITLEKLPPNVIKDNQPFISAFKYAYNTIKHEKNPFDLTFLNFGKSSIIGLARVGEARIGLGPAVEWGDLPLNSPSYKNQFLNYNSVLKSQEILDTFDSILTIIKSID